MEWKNKRPLIPLLHIRWLSQWPCQGSPINARIQWSLHPIRTPTESSSSQPQFQKGSGPITGRFSNKVKISLNDSESFEQLKATLIEFRNCTKQCLNWVSLLVIVKASIATISCVWHFEQTVSAVLSVLAGLPAIRMNRFRWSVRTVQQRVFVENDRDQKRDYGRRERERLFGYWNEWKYIHIITIVVILALAQSRQTGFSTKVQIFYI